MLAFRGTRQQVPLYRDAAARASIDADDPRRGEPFLSSRREQLLDAAFRRREEARQIES